MIERENPSTSAKSKVLSHFAISIAYRQYWELRFYGKLKQKLKEPEERPYYDEIPRC
jgi:hypothetical protein